MTLIDGVLFSVCEILVEENAVKNVCFRYGQTGFQDNLLKNRIIIFHNLKRIYNHNKNK
jgi:hypothetical protein